MTRTFTEDFETGPNGATLSPSTNTSYDAGSLGTGATRTFDAAHAIIGTYAANFTVGATSATSLLRRSFTSTSLRYFREYSAFSVVGGGTLRRFKDVRSTSTVLARLQLSTAGKLQATDGNTAVWTSTATLTALTAYRFEWMVNATTGKQRARLFMGANLHGTVPDEDSGDVAYTGGAFDNHQDGVTTATTTWTVWKDGVANDDTTWVGPAVTPPGQASGAGTFTFTGAGVGSRPAKGSGAGTFTFAGAGVGSRTPKAGGAGVFTFAGSGTGARTPKAAGAGVFTFTGTGVGARAPLAAGAGQVAYDGTGVGERAPYAAGAGAVAWSGTGAAVRHPEAAGDGGALTWTGAGAGSTPAKATGAGAVAWVGAGAGVRHPVAVGAGELAWVGVGVVIPPPSPDRLDVVAAESRTSTVGGESRTSAVPAENRTTIATGGV